MITSVSFHSAAQEFNLGLHLNPALTFPVSTAQSRHDPALRTAPFKFGYSYGLVVSATSGRFGVETGGSIVEKSYSVRQSDFKTPSETGVTAKSTFAVSALEVPLVLKYRLAEHTGRTQYSTHLLLGASHEWINPHVISEDRRRDTAASDRYSISVLSTTLPDAANFSWPTLIAGAQIRAVLLGAGLIEYGVAMHVPLQATGPFSVETRVLEAGQLTQTFRGDFYPRLAYLDLRLRYYLLSFRKGEGRVRYR